MGRHGHCYSKLQTPKVLDSKNVLWIQKGTLYFPTISGYIYHIPPPPDRSATTALTSSIRLLDPSNFESDRLVTIDCGQLCPGAHLRVGMGAHPHPRSLMSQDSNRSPHGREPGDIPLCQAAAPVHWAGTIFPHYSAFFQPSTNKLLRKNAKWHWTYTHAAAFEHIKQSLLNAPVLRLPSRDEPFKVVADASGVGIGAVLLQGDRLVAFDGRKLSDAELKWSATEQEMLAVVYHWQKWRCYLDGVRFTVVTDHQPNTWFGSQKRLTPRLHRWYEQLRGFDFEWQYKPGRVNVADPLSRHPSFSAQIAAVTRGRGKPAAATETAAHDPQPSKAKRGEKRKPGYAFCSSS